MNAGASISSRPAGLTRLPSTTPWWISLGPRIAIVASDPEHRAFLQRHVGVAGVVVATPLDLIKILERDDVLIATVVLLEVRGSTELAELAKFVQETYAVRVVASRNAAS